MQSVQAQQPAVFAAAPSFLRFTRSFFSGSEPCAASALPAGNTFIFPDDCKRYVWPSTSGMSCFPPPAQLAKPNTITLAQTNFVSFLMNQRSPV
jgi:hypothetical protein